MKLYDIVIVNHTHSHETILDEQFKENAFFAPGGCGKAVSITL